MPEGVIDSTVTDTSSIELVAAYHRGDESAADRLFERYRNRLIALATRQMSLPLRRRLDPEDVVQSAYMTFVVGSRAGSFQLQQRGDFWNLLVRITVNKVRSKVDYHRAAIRTISRDADLAEAAELISREPSPEAVAVLTEEVEKLLHGRSKPAHRRMTELFLAGYSLREIAAETGYSQERVRQVIRRVAREYAEEWPT
jgi:RNA polymerase sigma-70 factor (ECF subfamily)